MVSVSWPTSSPLLTVLLVSRQAVGSPDDIVSGGRMFELGPDGHLVRHANATPGSGADSRAGYACPFRSLGEQSIRQSRRGDLSATSLRNLIGEFLARPVHGLPARGRRTRPARCAACRPESFAEAAERAGRGSRGEGRTRRSSRSSRCSSEGRPAPIRCEARWRKPYPPSSPQPSASASPGSAASSPPQAEK